MFYPGQSLHGYYGGSHYSQAAFFCGNGPECSNFESREMIEKAKENVERSVISRGWMGWDGMDG